METDFILRVKFWTFKNVGKGAPVMSENKTPPYPLMRPATSGFPTTPTTASGFSGSLIRHGSGSLIPLPVANLGKIN
jgi:hypothetical protein